MLKKLLSVLIALVSLLVTACDANYEPVGYSGNPAYVQITGIASLNDPTFLGSVSIIGNTSSVNRLYMNGNSGTNALTFRTTSVTENTQIGELSAWGNSTSGKAHIRAEDDGLWTASANPTKWIFDATPQSNTTVVRILTLYGGHKTGLGIASFNSTNSHTYISLSASNSTYEEGIIFRNNEARTWQIKDVVGMLQFNQGTGTKIVANITGSGWNVTSINSTSNITGPNITSLNPQICIVTSSVNWSIPHNSGTNIAWDTNIKDPSGMHLGSDGNITINIPGYYQIFAMVHFSANSTGQRQVGLSSTGSSYVSKQTVPATTGEQWVTATGILWANAGDKIFVTLYQNSGGALNVVSSSSQVDSYFAVNRLIG